MSQTDGKEAGTNKANTRLAAMCVAMVVAMGGLAYASVPLYELFCQVTGYGGTTQRAETSDGIKISDREITVLFDANIEKGFGWEFKPVQRSVKVRLGEQVQVAYRATNISDRPLSGTATFNVTPLAAGIFFNKIECFCFTQTTLQPGESMDMPVVFFVDPDIADEVETRNTHTITLSYTFFEDETAEKPVAGLPMNGEANGENRL